MILDDECDLIQDEEVTTCTNCYRYPICSKWYEKEKD